MYGPCGAPIHVHATHGWRRGLTCGPRLPALCASLPKAPCRPAIVRQPALTGKPYRRYPSRQRFLQQHNLSSVVHRVLRHALEEPVKIVAAARDRCAETLVFEALDGLNQFQVSGKE